MPCLVFQSICGIIFNNIVSMLPGYQMGADEGQEEYEEVQADLRKKEEEVSRV